MNDKDWAEIGAQHGLGDQEVAKQRANWEAFKKRLAAVPEGGSLSAVHMDNGEHMPLTVIDPDTQEEPLFAPCLVCEGRGWIEDSPGEWIGCDTCAGSGKAA